MRHLLVIMLVILAAATAALAQPGDPGEPEQQVTAPASTAQAVTEMLPPVAYNFGPKEGETLPDGRKVGTPQGELPATQSDIAALREEWQKMDRQASSAQRRGDGRSFARARQKANGLALQISALSNRVGYLEQNPLGGTPESHQAVYDNLRQVGFITQGDADNLYAPKDGATVQPAVMPVNDKPAPPARRNIMEALVPVAWVLVIGVIVYLVAQLLWGRINEGIRIARGEGWLTRIQEQVNGRGQGNGGNVAPATGAANPATPEFAEAWRNANGVPTPSEPTRGRGWYSSGPGGSYAGAKFEWGAQPANNQPAGE